MSRLSVHSPVAHHRGVAIRLVCTMDSPKPLPFRASVVVLAITDRELLAWIALMLEMAGFRGLPLADVAEFDRITRDIQLRAIVVDGRFAEAETWRGVRHMQATTAAQAAQLLVIAGDSNDVPVDVVSQGARVLRWPFPLTDVLSLLEER